MRAAETTPAASLNAGVGEELNSGLVWPVSLVPRHGPWPLSYEREGPGQATTPVLPFQRNSGQQTKEPSVLV
jgi:hypothetical protein